MVIYQWYIIPSMKMDTPKAKAILFPRQPQNAIHDLYSQDFLEQHEELELENFELSRHKLLKLGIMVSR